MAEHLPHPSKNVEKELGPESHVEHQRHEQEKYTETIKHPEKHLDQTELEHLAKRAAKARHETALPQAETAPHEPVLGIQRELKAQAYAQTLRKIRSRLPSVERSFSKVIHQPTVEAISEATGKTLARPSGLLGGGLVSLVGSIIALYMSKHYGFRYNFFVYLLLLVVGFCSGVLLELAVRGARSKSK